MIKSLHYGEKELEKIVVEQIHFKAVPYFLVKDDYSDSKFKKKGTFTAMDNKLIQKKKYLLKTDDELNM